MVAQIVLLRTEICNVVYADLTLIAVPKPSPS